MPGVTTALDPRYGYSEQIAVPTSTTNKPRPVLVGEANHRTGDRELFYHTLGLPNDGTVNTSLSPWSLNEPWDYFAFNDRDFTSVAELLMVPGCPPGLFTKQFAEFAPRRQTSRPSSGL